MTSQCLTNSREAVVRSSLKLHSLLLICFALGLCFNAVSATISSEQVILETKAQTLEFDDIKTPAGFADIKAPYNGFLFEGFFAFNPAHPRFKGIISSHDLNCAVSKPNALYGTRDNFESRQISSFERRPSIRPANHSETFTLLALKIKPLDVPLGLVTINLQGYRSGADASLEWSVDFPAGFHDVLHVQIEEFSKQAWTGLRSVELWADFHHDTVVMDWEFCLDDINVEITMT
ncbi:hypothetical protein LTR10_024193 [Elasticomyces elasticus]|uniref:NADH:ubiquinone oxidoreductase intermediate-associated protein 30 domain-containing protein n=1 Tax=Exophiala sideris TaxID=1016849 RepID=A0ABR0JPR5_9EURO|nr:hypothetical protein LTR10_024193 [Elasticomyces elasticus]KAK5039580.1 hypothetical protein LTS07_000074 [Exophiala sideris]KAK5041132.1 hypothetical protein LTR13_002606 [Exophiala sideris]KAK5067957.1 hypothetical protein LTR69_000074 [Exophiala sideris]KAK5187259.1 hypothetical protein LTR44_000074 [Eurotiomycetes sp. CCFEE 6388]